MDEMENVEFLPEDEIESDLSEDNPEAEPDTELESEAEKSKQDPEEPAEDIGREEQLHDSELEPVNTLTVSGNVIVLPDGYDPVELQSYSSEDIAAVIESVEYQTDIIRGGIIGLAFLLGIIGGILLIHGFRLRRV